MRIVSAREAIPQNAEPRPLNTEQRPLDTNQGAQDQQVTPKHKPDHTQEPQRLKLANVLQERLVEEQREEGATYIRGPVKGQRVYRIQDLDQCQVGHFLGAMICVHMG